MNKVSNFLKYLFKYQNKQIDRTMFYICLLCIVTVIFHVGYLTDRHLAEITERITKFMFYFLIALTSIRTVSSIFALKKINVTHYAEIAILIYLIFITLARNFNKLSINYFSHNEWMYIGIVIIFIAQLSKNSLLLDRLYVNPTIFFVISFLALILLGTILLMLPRTTLTHSLPLIDAFFMATSAVCITGLNVIDISTNFSFFGQTVILCLIQIGGLGIMTFTGFFGYFFSGGFSFKNQLMFGEMLGENKLNEVIATLLKIICITLLFEAIGALVIFFTIDASLFSSTGDRLFFAVFHAISGFCNSGFTLLKDGISNSEFRFNYNFQLALSCMFIFGTLGFGPVYNFYTFVKTKIKGFIFRFILKKRYVHKAHNFSFNTKFILYCNLIVIALGTISFFILEYKNTLNADQSLLGKISTSFFMANSSRTAGFESIDINTLGIPTLIMFISMMWIGSSPGSTGGGVKVTTIAIALMNILALTKGKEDIELFRRRVAYESVNKAFAIIFLSVFCILTCFIFLNFTDSKKDTVALLFESVSAYTTCGLSLGVTPTLSTAGKMVLMFTMFIGRVGMFTLLVAFIKDTKNKSYIYPTEKIQF